MTSTFAPRTHRFAAVVVIALVALAHGWLLQAWAGDKAVAAPAPTVPTAPPDRPTPVTVALAPTAAPEAVRVKSDAPAPTSPPKKKPAAEPKPPPRSTASTTVSSDLPQTPSPSNLEVTSLAPRAAPEAEPPASAPDSTQLRYTLTRGALRGQGQLNWSRDGSRYRMELVGEVPLLGRIFVQHSDGLVDAHGLLPVRHTERRIRRSERALNFIRPDDGSAPRLSFSSRTDSLPLRPGTQDRLSWMAQLAARLAARPGHGSPVLGSQIQMDVASVSGDVQPWTFILQDASPDGLWHWRRESDDPHDTHAEVWTDPGRQHWPVRVQLRESSGEPLELVLREARPGPP